MDIARFLLELVLISKMGWVILFCAFILTWYFYNKITTRRLVEASANIPGWPTLPFIGNMHQVMTGSSKVLSNTERLFQEAESKGGVMKYWIGSRLYYIINDLDDMEKVLKVCMEKDEMYKFGRPWVGEGLFTASMPVWKRNIKIISPTFNHTMVKGFLDYFNQYGAIIAKEFEEHAGTGPFNPQHLLLTSTLKLICKTAMGIEFFNDSKYNFDDVLNATQFNLNVVQTRISNPLYYFDIIFDMTSLSKEFYKQIKMLRNMADEVLESKKLAISKGEVIKGGKNFLDQILEINSDGKWLTPEEVTDEVMTTLLAGQETTSLTTLYTLLLISSYPEIQKKIIKEIDDVSVGPDAYFRREDLDKCVYLDAVIKESMRLYPIGPFISRKAHCDVALTRHVLPAGASFVVGAWSVQRSKKIWGETALDFKPERWFDSASLPSHPYAYGPFGFGRRVCVGRHYAMLALKVFIAHIFRKVTLTGDVKNLKFKMDIMLRPACEQFVEVTKRQRTLNKE